VSVDAARLSRIGDCRCDSAGVTRYSSSAISDDVLLVRRPDPHDEDAT
jgi:hypothetical protein